MWSFFYSTKPTTVSIPNCAYASPFSFPRKHADVYPIFLTHIQYIYFTRSLTRLYPAEIILKQDLIVLKHTNSPLGFSEPLPKVARLIKTNLSKIDSVGFEPTVDSQSFYEILLPISIKKIFKINVVISYNDKVVIWENSNSANAEKISAYIKSIQFTSFNCKAFGLQNSKNIMFINKSTDDAFSQSQFKQPITFIIPINPLIKFVLRKYQDYIQRDMKSFCVSCTKKDLMKGNFSPGNTQIVCSCLNKVCKELFLERINQYSNSVHKHIDSITIPNAYVVELCRHFNTIWENQPVMLRHVKSKNQHGNVELLYVFEKEKRLYSENLKLLSENHRVVEITKPVTDELQNTFNSMGIITTTKSERIYGHTFSTAHEQFLDDIVRR